jgi:deazaflavin-dependent oxidoreductase (nitroreductase family)
MNGFQRAWNRIGGWFLVRSGRTGLLTTKGRRTGQARSASIGYGERAAGGYFVGAGSPGRAWAANLVANPECTFTVRGTAMRCRAELLDGAARDEAIEAFRARIGSAADRASWAELFALVPLDEPGASARTRDDTDAATRPTA